jgi:hypothetical protein
MRMRVVSLRSKASCVTAQLSASMPWCNTCKPFSRPGFAEPAGTDEPPVYTTCSSLEG